MKIIEIELSDDALSQIVREYFEKHGPPGHKIGPLEITETDDELRFVRFRVKD